MNLILAIDTSCDETSAAVTDETRVLANVISSQVDLHKKYGGVYPSLAKRAHEERIDYVVKEALRRASKTLNSKHEARNPKQNIRNSNSSNTKRFENWDFENSNLFRKFGLLAISEEFPSKAWSFRISDFPLKAVAVTQGPGLAIALEVGIRKAKELATINKLPLIAINHLEGHIYSCLAENIKRKGIPPLTEPALSEVEGLGRNDNDPNVIPSEVEGSLPPATFQFPSLCLIVSGGHTQLVLMKDHGKYEIVGETLDDACGEALDKAAKILRLGYPGGPIIERLASQGDALRAYALRAYTTVIPTKRSVWRDPFGKAIGERGSSTRPATAGLGRNDTVFHFNPSLPQKSNLNFSYSGLKTQLLYLVQDMPEEEFGKNLGSLAFSFQSACFEQIIRKTSQAIKVYQPKMLVCGGGVIANKYLRKLLRKTARSFNLTVLFPPKKELITDNAAMIGVAAYFKMLKGEFVKNPETLDREPRMSL